MKSYAQNGEDLIILDYWNKHFKLDGYTPTVVSFGENNGTDLSNAKLLIENGFKALLIEPSGQFETLQNLHKDNHFVTCLNVAVSDKDGVMDFYESGAHVKNGTDKALVSTLNIDELKRWPGVKFEKKSVSVLGVNHLRNSYDFNWDIISLDCEGHDWTILSQINPVLVGCKILVVEWNSISSLATQFTNYCAKFGMKEIHRNGENLIFVRC